MTCSASAVCSRARSPRPGSGSQRTSGMFKKVDAKSLQIFSRQFATLIESGVSVVASLSILQDQTDDKNLAAVIGAVRADVESGMILSKAMSQHPGGLQPALRLDGRGGEASGTLDQRPRPGRGSRSRRDADQASRQGSDDLPDRRHDLRLPRAGRDAALPRPGVREDLLPAPRPTPDADPDRRRLLELRCATTGSSSSRCSAVDLGRPSPLEADRAGPAEVGHLQAPHPDEDRRRRPEGDDGALLAHARNPRRRRRRHHQGARDHRQRPPATGSSSRRSPRCG